MPNCPFRTAEDIKGSFARFQNSDADTQLSVTRFGWLNPWWAMKLGTRLEPLFPEALKTRSQDLQTLFCPTGAVWWAKPEALKQHKTFYAANYGGYELSWDHALDIDDEDDWKMAEAVLLLREREK
jgi:N-acylneuraminate cytidylyltransferase